MQTGGGGSKAERESWSPAQAVGQPERKAEDATGRREPEVEVSMRAEPEGWQAAQVAGWQQGEAGGREQPVRAGGEGPKAELEGRSPTQVGRRREGKAEKATQLDCEIFNMKRQRPRSLAFSSALVYAVIWAPN